jgi:hypothetical protein
VPKFAEVLTVLWSQKQDQREANADGQFHAHMANMISLPCKLNQERERERHAYAGGVGEKFSSLTEVLAFFKTVGAKGGRAAAKKMSKAQRTARAKKAAAASVKVRQKKARERKKAEKSAAKK